MVVAPRTLPGRWASPFLGSLLLVALAPGCRSKATNAGDGRPAGSTSASSPPVAAPSESSCSAVGSAPALTVGEARPKPPQAEVEEDEDQDVELPFSVDLGSARASTARFAVGGIQSRGGSSYAFIAVVDANGERGQSVEFGRVFGEAEPPAIAPFRDGWLAVVADNDASAVTLRLAALGPPFDSAALRRGAEVGSARRDAPEFALAVSGAEALLVWTKLDKGRGRIHLGVIDAEKLTLKGEARALPVAADDEAESPRLVARPGGYFLAYIVRGAAPRPKFVPVRSKELDGGVGPQLLDEGPTAIEVVPLDGSGVVLSAPRRVTPPGARVISFDLTAAPEAGALLVYRDDREGPGLDRSNAEAVLVRADGTTLSKTWEVGPSAGLPAVLVDAEPAPARPWAWVFVPTERGLGLGGLLSSAGEPLGLGELGTDPRLAGTEVLAVQGGRMLMARAKGAQRELSVVSCRLGVRAAEKDGGT